MFSLNVTTMEDTTKKLLNLQSVLQPTAQAIPSPRLLQQLFSKAEEMMEHPGDEAWFDVGSDKQGYKVPNTRTNYMLPARHVFYRIKEKLPAPPSPSIQEVNDVLAKLQEAAANEWERLQHQQQGGGNVEAAAVQNRVNPMGAMDGDLGPIQELTAKMNREPQHQQERFGTDDDGSNGNGNYTLQVPPSTPNVNLPGSPGGIVELFSTSDQGILPNPPPALGRRGRHLKKPALEISSMCRSKRQACSKIKHLSAEERAKDVFCWRLGYIKDDTTPVEEANQGLHRTFQGPMPQYIIKAMMAVFHLEDEDLCKATNALIKIGSTEVMEAPMVINNVA